MGGLGTVVITFPQSPNSACSIRNRVVIPPVDFDETVSSDQVVNVNINPAPGITAEVTVNLMVNFSPAENVSTVAFGVCCNYNTIKPHTQ